MGERAKSTHTHTHTHLHPQTEKIREELPLARPKCVAVGQGSSGKCGGSFAPLAVISHFRALTLPYFPFSFRHDFYVRFILVFFSFWGRSRGRVAITFSPSPFTVRLMATQFPPETV